MQNSFTQQNKVSPHSPEATASPLMEIKNIVQYVMCVGVIFILLFAVIDVFPPTNKIQKRVKKPTSPPRCVGKKKCVDKMSIVKKKVAFFCSLNVLSQQRQQQQPPSECQLILLSSHQILHCFHISST